MRGRARLGVICVVYGTLLLCCSGTPASAAVPADAFGNFGDHRIVYPPYESVDRGTPSATAVGVGDVNGDGLEDSALVLDSYEVAYQPSAWVTFAPPDLPATESAGGGSWRGFRIVSEHFWHALTGLGDVNGDGFGEVAVEGTNGTLAVVFGRLDGQTVDLDALGDDGFRITDVAFGSAIGFGHVSHGIAFQNQTMTAVGDQNGDRRPDLAFRDGRSVKVAYSPPDPAGKTIDSNALGDQGYTLEAESSNVFVGRLGDLDRDGREDVAVTWGTEGASSAASVPSPAPGETVDLTEAASRGGFELVLPEFRLENGLTLGDQNGDGRRDVGLSGYGPDHDRRLVVAYTPPAGTSRVGRPGPGEGFDDHVYDSNISDVGDQDGDGRSDIAYSDEVRLSGGSRGAIDTGLDLGGALVFVQPGVMIIGSVDDRNGDGKRELLTVHADPYNDEPGDYHATWMMETFLSAPTPVPDVIDLPVEVPGGVDFGGIFQTAPSPTRTLAARAAVSLQEPGGVTMAILAPNTVDAGQARTRADVHVDAALLTPGQTYAYRVALENGRGLVGTSAARSFVYRPGRGPGQPTQEGTTGPGATPVLPRRPSCASRASARPLRLRVVGTRSGERLVGGPGRDLLRGRGGRDRLSGCGRADRLEGGDGADRLDGGRGRDKLLGGPGRDRIAARDRTRDRISCGPGLDHAIVDRGDRVRGCERVSRRN